MEQSPTFTRLAAVGGTRQLIAEESFTALVNVLVDCKAIPRDVMADALAKLSGRLVGIARGRIETDYVLHQPELFDRAASLEVAAADLRLACLLGSPAPSPVQPQRSPRAKKLCR